MRVSWNWLAEFVDLEGLDPHEVADKLTMSGMEVEGVEVVGGEMDTIVVGHVVACEPHPQADKLSVCTVDAGQGEPLQIVCGAPNVATGVRAPVALVGTTMPGDFKIKKAKLRGVPSHGMLCSASEIGISEESDGLLLLDDEPAAGTRITDLFGLRDVVLDISLTPNRPDGLSIRGVAREVGTLFDRAVREVESTPLDAHETEGEIADVMSLEIDDADGCPRYACVAIRDVRIGQAPAWMRQRLEAVGQRPVSNIVDVTNYILFEQGQPLHAFDLDRVRDGKIVVRRATAGERIEAIDHVERELDPTDLLICDGVGPVAIAGVMGGAESEIGDETTDILIECANFDPTSVRRTARRHGMHTESSHRFERGVDVERIPAVLARTVDLILETQRELGHTCTVVGGALDAYSKPYEAPVIRLDLAYPGRILGMEITPEVVVSSLERLGMRVARVGEAIDVSIPAYRPDLERPIDLVEEVGRVVGYDNLPSTPVGGALGLIPVRRTDEVPHAQAAQPVRTTAELETQSRLRSALIERGLYEAVNWGMVDPSRTALFTGDEDGIKLKNPLGSERSVMRRNLAVGLLDNVAHNLSHGTSSLGLFEIGRVYPPGEIADENLEPTHLGGVFAGDFVGDWSSESRPVDGHDVVGVITNALRAASIDVQVVTDEPPMWAHPAESAALRVGRRNLGWVGRFHPDVLDAWGIEVPVYGFELTVGELIAAEHPIPQYEKIARTPSSDRDAALVVDTTVSWSDFQSALRGYAHKLLESVSLFDVFSGGSLPDGKKSVAIRAVYRDPNGTLTDTQVDKAHSKLLRHLERSVGAELRA